MAQGRLNCSVRDSSAQEFSGSVLRKFPSFEASLALLLYRICGLGVRPKRVLVREARGPGISAGSGHTFSWQTTPTSLFMQARIPAAQR